MGYGRSIYNEAIDEISKRKSNAENIASNNLSEFLNKCPRAAEIKAEINSFHIKIAKAVLSKGAKTQMEELKAKNLALQEEYELLLKKHGFSKRDITPQYCCKKCGDRGFDDGRMCSCLKNLQRSIAYQRLSAKAPLEKCRFDNFSLDYYKSSEENFIKMNRILDFCKKYADNFTIHSPSLLFRGATGLGKTHISLAIANIVIEKGYGVIYGSTQSFSVALERERFDRQNESADNSTNTQLNECDLLILDDLGTEVSTAYVTAALYDIVNTRLLSSKPTIISTNLSLKELEVRYSERFTSRILGQYGTFEFVGADIRYQKLKKRADNRRSKSQ